MERGALEDIYSDPRHPYLKALMRAVPRIGLDRGERLTPIREVERSSQGYVLTGRDAAQSVAVDEPLLRYATFPDLRGPQIRSARIERGHAGARP